MENEVIYSLSNGEFKEDDGKINKKTDPKKKEVKAKSKETKKTKTPASKPKKAKKVSKK